MNRIHLHLTPATGPVSFNYLDGLRSTLHHWLGRDNDLHDTLSIYSFGWLQGSLKVGDHLEFPRGARWQISFYDADAAKQALAGIMRDPEVFYGMRVHDVQEQAVPAFSSRHRFVVDSPVIARRQREDGTRAYLLWNHASADEALTRVLHRKMEAAGLPEEHRRAAVRFDRAYDGAHTKLAEIKGTKHKGSICPVVVEGAPEAVRFAWLVGVGELTGCGFGALR